MKKDKRIDAYILKSQDFAIPILMHLRSLVNKYCQEAEETMKWSFPHFMYKGSILCSMAAFKQHCAFGFWKGGLIPDLTEIINAKGDTAMGQFGQIRSVKDLPSDKLFAGYFKKAIQLQEDGIKLPQRVKKDTTKTLEVPDYFSKVLRKNKKAFQLNGWKKGRI